MPNAVRTIIVALLLSALLTPPSGRACAPAPRTGQFVRIAEESAIIVWDEAAHTQHFIRRATFDTEAPDFGFLVPTPTKPTLAEVSDAAYTDLEYLIRPKVIEQKVTGVDFTPLLFGYFFLRSRYRAIYSCAARYGVDLARRADSVDEVETT